MAETAALRDFYRFGWFSPAQPKTMSLAQYGCRFSRWKDIFFNIFNKGGALALTRAGLFKEYAEARWPL